MTTELPEVWCGRCPSIAAEMVWVRRNGETVRVPRCSNCLWLLRSPRGLGRKDAKRPLQSGADQRY